MSEKKDHIITVLTETVETQKTVIDQLEQSEAFLKRFIDYGNDQLHESKKQHKETLKWYRFSVLVNIVMLAVITYLLIR